MTVNRRAFIVGSAAAVAASGTVSTVAAPVKEPCPKNKIVEHRERKDGITTFRYTFNGHDLTPYGNRVQNFMIE